MQRYLEPEEIVVTDGSARPTKALKNILQKDGQIVPLLIFENDAGKWETADTWQGERLRALQELDWDLILTEDDWTDEDL